MQGTPLHTASAAQVRRVLVIVAAALGVLTVVGLVVFWPRGSAPDLRPGGVTVEYVDATVLTVGTSTCGSAESQAPRTANGDSTRHLGPQQG